VKFVRIGTAISTVALSLGIVVAAPAPSAQAGCGFLGLEACQPPNSPPTTGTVNAPFDLKDCGPAIKATATRNWTCTFADQFNGTTLNRKRWLVMTGNANGNPNGNWNCYVDSPSTVSLSSSSLHLVVRKNTTPTFCSTMNRSTYWTGGMVSTYRLFSQSSGRFQVRMKVNKLAAGAGLQEAFWLWPDDRYTSINPPRSGEIDISELYSFKPHLAIPYLHYGPSEPGPRIGINTARNCKAARGAWNIYTLTWRPDRLVMQVNGKTCLVNTSGDPAFRNRYIINLTAALGQAANSYTGTDPRFRAVTSIDYVRAWR
jgi:beta-glucanase (GH16 family)